jgi:hypothetical protein
MRERGLSIRSVSLGLAGGTLICLLVPYSDLVMQNTPLVGNNLPLGVTMLFFALALLVNGPLSKWKPKAAFSSSELAVAFTLMLVMCAIPSTGLMRYLLPNLASPWALGVENAEYQSLLSRLTLSPYIFPQFTGDKPADWIGDPIATGFVGRWIDSDRSPLSAWVVPFFTWAIFVGALCWALLCISCIVFHHWRHNEHLAFPLASVQLALVEAPAPGRWLNRVLGSTSFWVAFGAVLLLHVNNGLAQYFPKNFVLISKGYDLSGLFSEAPLAYADPILKRATVYFSMIGIAFFLSGPVSFSLWFVVVFMQCLVMFKGSMTGDPTIYAVHEQRHGAALALFLSITWLGRRHLALVGRQMIRGVVQGEHPGAFLSNRVAGWGAAIGFSLMVAWLVFVGVSWPMAINLVVLLLIGFVLITRVIAETGIFYGAMPTSVAFPYEIGKIYFDAKPAVNGLYMTSLAQGTFYDYREVLSVYATHGMRVTQVVTPASKPPEAERRDGRRLIGWICVALVLAYGVSFWSSLWVHYNYNTTLDASHRSPIDPWGKEGNPRWQTLGTTIALDADNRLNRNYDQASQFGIGFAVTTVLSVLRLTFAWWPLHPVGYLLYGTTPSNVLWFSIFIGWIIKRVVMRLGSATFYEQCKPFFIGLILGDVGGAAFWLIVSVALNAMGLPYQSIVTLPR